MAARIRMLKKDPHQSIKIERLKARGATMFAGTTDPVDAKIWMDTLEKCFDEMGCLTDDKKVRLASFLLQEGASDWWKSVRSKRVESKVTNWSEFKKAFYEEYYPQSYGHAKQNEFLKLVQGSMTVAEYLNKYIELSKHATTMIIQDEIDKCRKFEDGLREEIRTSICAVEWREFKKLVEAALEVERSISERKSEKESSKNVCDVSIGTVTTSSSGKELEDDNEFFIRLHKHGTSKSKIIGNPSSSSCRKQDTGSPILMTREQAKSSFSDEGQFLKCSLRRSKESTVDAKGESSARIVIEQSKARPTMTDSEPKLKQQVGTPRTHW